MRHIFIGLLLTLVAAFLTRAQEVSTVGLRIERLRAHLRDMVDREAELQDRGRLFEDDLRPENIERSVATVGTADVVALRAHRREQIRKQKADVGAQLSGVGTKRAALEVEIAPAEAEAIRLKAAALGADNAAPRPAPITYWTEKLKLDRNDVQVIPASHPDVIIRMTDAEHERVVIAQS